MNTVSIDTTRVAGGPGVSKLSLVGTFGFPDLAGTVVNFVLANALSPAKLEVVDLDAGDNEIDVPLGAATVVIIPPTDNTDVIILSGDDDDVGVTLHRTAPTMLSLDTTVASFFLSTTDDLNGVKLAWF